VDIQKRLMAVLQLAVPKDYIGVYVHHEGQGRNAPVSRYEQGGLAHAAIAEETRFWTYPCTAGVDATEEVLAAYKAWQDAAVEKEQQRRVAYEAKTPSKGKRVTVIG